MATSTRKIIHIDMDAFYASVEQRDNPELRGKPVAVGGSGNRGVVAAASYEARAFGVHSALSSKIAKRRCPDLIFVKPRFPVYKATSLVIRTIFKEYTDLIEPLSLDEAYLDVTSNKKGIQIATEIALQIKERIKEQTGLTASAGVSINKFLAKVASDMDKPDGLYVIKPHQVEGFVDKLPIEKFFGVGKVTATKMKAMGIFTGKDLKKFPEQMLVDKFGKAGHYFYQVSRGVDDRPVEPDRERKSLGAETTFEEDYDQLDVLLKELDKLSIEVANRLKRADASGRTLTIKIKFSDFNQITRSKTIEGAITTEKDIRDLSREILTNSYVNGMKVRLLGVTVSNFIEGHKPKTDDQLTMEL